MTDDEAARAEVRQLVAAINDAWLRRRGDDLPRALGPYFHPTMTIRGPNGQELAHDRAAVIASYVDFVRQATVVSFEADDPDIELAGGVALASYGWRMVYELGGARHDEAGREVFTFVEADGRWVATARTILP